MKAKHILQLVGILILFSSLLPIAHVSADEPPELPPADMFQLPWEQGETWVTLAGIDNGFRYGRSSTHYYLFGGALDFAPHLKVRTGEDTSDYWVTAVAPGLVIEKGVCHLKIAHGNGWVSEYQFLGNFQVELGDEVYRNQRLAIIADGIKYRYCPPALKPDRPHLHFSLRPTMIGVTFAGWEVNFDPLYNKNTFTKNDLTLGLYQPLKNLPGIQIVLREPPLEWDTHYQGSVDAYRYERWTLILDKTREFKITVNPLTDGLEPLIVLMDESGEKLTRGTGSITSVQPAGRYYVQIQPETGQGFYDLVAESDGIQTEPYVSVRAPENMKIGEKATVSVDFGNVPPSGYTSAEITCSYDPALLSVDNFLPGDIFGVEPVAVSNTPQDGQFIFAIAGSNGQKAQTSGTVFTFDVTALASGKAYVECAARVSTGDGTLQDILSIGETINISGEVVDPVPGPTPPVVVDGILLGQVLASKPATVDLYNAQNELIQSVQVDENGTFSMQAPADTYTIIASRDGFLPAQGVANFVAGESISMSTVTLFAGDLDGNSVIDQFDAMTIGMNYNTPAPDAADLNADGIINVLDLEMLAAHYRASGVHDWQ